MSDANDLIRQLIRGRGTAPHVPPAWMVQDSGSPLWLARDQWPQNMIVFPMPGDELRLPLTALKGIFDRANQPELAARVGTLISVGGRDADATVVGAHARLGIRPDNTVILVAEPAEKLALVCRKVAGDQVLKLSARSCWRGQAPGKLDRVSVTAWRQEKPGQPVTD